MRTSFWACGVVILVAGCARHQHKYGEEVSPRCSECSSEWLSPGLNQADDGYGSKHYAATRQQLVERGLNNTIQPEAALGRLEALERSREHLWHTYAQQRLQNSR